MTPRSLRGRLLLASVLWTSGLVVLVSMALSHLFERSPWARAVIHVHGFLQAPLVIAGSTLCLIAGVLLVKRSLRSIDGLRSRLQQIHSGTEQRLEGAYPSEVQPLVTDLNALIDHREQAIQRAVSKAGDLAHGLKTPLAILSQEADRARQEGQVGLADALDQQLDRMRRQVDYHLAHARAAASGVRSGARSSVRESADGLVRAMQRLHAGRGLVIESAVSSDVTAAVQREDLDEMLGNLLDNACKWARTRVSIAAATNAGAVLITVDDDGQGLAAELREAVLQRGVRADEAAPGSGLGLAIVRDLADVYGGSIELDASAAGGLRARLRVPAAPTPGPPRDASHGA